MREWSRRRALQAVATTGAFVLAGCSGEGGSPRSTARDRGEPIPPGDLEVLFVRDTDGDPLFDVESGADDGMSPGDGGIEARRTRSEYLWDMESRDRVTFRSTEPAAELRAFVDEADLEYLVERPVNACYEARLVGVYREDGGVVVDLCQSLQSADIACSAGGVDTVGIGVRLPFPGDGPGGHDWNWRGDCGGLRTVASEGDGGQ